MSTLRQKHDEIQIMAAAKRAADVIDSLDVDEETFVKRFYEGIGESSDGSLKGRLESLKAEIGEELFATVASGDSLMSVLEEHEEAVGTQKIETMKKNLRNILGDRSGEVKDIEIASYINVLIKSL